jgi:hypothetical protein
VTPSRSLGAMETPVKARSGAGGSRRAREPRFTTFQAQPNWATVTTAFRRNGNAVAVQQVGRSVEGDRPTAVCGFASETSIRAALRTDRTIRTVVSLKIGLWGFLSLIPRRQVQRSSSTAAKTAVRAARKNVRTVRSGNDRPNRPDRPGSRLCKHCSTLPLINAGSTPLPLVAKRPYAELSHLTHPA